MTSDTFAGPLFGPCSQNPHKTCTQKENELANIPKPPNREMKNIAIFQVAATNFLVDVYRGCTFARWGVREIDLTLRLKLHELP